MTVARGNSGNIFARGGPLANGKPTFVEIRVNGKNFNADLVADPNNPADVAGAIGSDLERISELVSQYGTIIAVTLEGPFVNYIMDYDTAFTDPAVAQELFDRIVDELGIVMGAPSHVNVSEYFDLFPFGTPA